jgi:carbamoyltransferase
MMGGREFGRRQLRWQRELQPRARDHASLMNILGINHYFHDTSACLVKNGELVAAVEEERLTREKHTTAFPVQAVALCLRLGGIDPQEVDHVAVSVDPTHKWNAKLAYAARHFQHAQSFMKSELKVFVARKRSLDAFMSETWPDPARRPTLHHVQHHLSHVGGSFFVSHYHEAALLGMDGSGEWATSLLGHGRGDSIDIHQQSWFPMSLGSFYEAVTDWVGFRPNFDEGKTMGLAPYGDPAPFYRRVASLVRVEPDGEIWLDLDHFNHQFHGIKRYSDRFVDTFGPPRKHDRDAPFESHHKDVAASFQRVLEDRVLAMCQILHRRTRCKHLVIAGGVALNSVMNGRIIREGPFEDLYVMPGAGDNGTSIGAAYYALTALLGHPRAFVHDDPYVGNEYSDAELRAAIESSGLKAERHDAIEEVAAELLARGRMLGWFQARMEFGPRALGSRSILANPMLPDMKAALNARVKHREAFRPFAPACPQEVAADFFETRVPDPFMLKVCYVRPEARARLPAITHVDGSARLQTVEQKHHPRFHRLLIEFGMRTGIPVLLNTSFNVMGEPIIEHPIQAIRCFFSTGLDELVLGNYVVRKLS